MPPTADLRDRPWVDPSTSAPPLALPVAARRLIDEAVAAGYPHETCGLLVGRFAPGRTEVVRAAQAANLNTERAADRYELDPADFHRIETAADADGLEVVGIWHSHPDVAPIPSETDHVRAWDGYAYLIVRVGDAGAEEWRSWLRDGETFREQAIHVAASDEESTP